MEVILTQDYHSLGYTGDKVKVRGGYARNFLLPRGIAVEAHSRNARVLKHRISGINARKAKLKTEAEGVSKGLQELTLEFTLKMGVKGKSYGSIAPRDIEAILREKGFNVDRRQIRLHEVIKGGGEYEASVKLHSEVTVPVKLLVSVERQKPAPQEAAEGGRGRRRRGRKQDDEATQQDEGTEASAEEAAPEEAASDEQDS